MDYSEKIRKTIEKIKEADFIFIGAGAGFSAAGGLTYSGERFDNNFEEFIDKYKMTDMYSAGFYPFKTLEEKWGYWAKHIDFNFHLEGASQIYKDLYNIIKGKEYFVLTTNVDGQFEKSHFDMDKVFEYQGRYDKFQCKEACHNVLYDNYDIVKQMVKSTKDTKIPSELIPYCPRCQEPMAVNLRIDDKFVQDDIWYKKQSKIEEFIAKLKGKKVVLLELGVGYNTPGIIRYPFERLTASMENATLVRFNKDYTRGMKEIEDRKIVFKEDMKVVIEDILIEIKNNLK